MTVITTTDHDAIEASIRLEVITTMANGQAVTMLDVIREIARIVSVCGSATIDGAGVDDGCPVLVVQGVRAYLTNGDTVWEG
jgi:hypothetical protein